MSGPPAELVDRLRGAGCVFAEDEARLLVEAGRTPDHLAALLERRLAGTPLEHVLGWAEFRGLRVVVEPGVFVPRRRSALLVDEAASRLGGVRSPVVVDLCCGTGAIGAALLDALGSRPGDPPQLYAVDVDPAAVGCARRNVPGARVLLGDLFDPLPPTLRGRVDVVLVNAPYVPTREIALMPGEARLHEPRHALDGGPDGVDVHRRVAAQAPRWLSPGGGLLVETSERQASLTAQAVSRAGLGARVVRDDDLDATVVVGTRVDD